MQPPQQHSWINLVEVKSQLVKKLGMERSKQYLDYLNRFLSLKLSKTEFDNLCLRTLGKDNIRLHNQLIRSVLKNACTKVHHQNGSVPVVTSPLTLTNGDILPPSPRKARTLPRDRRVTDRKSALGPNGKTNYGSFSPSVSQSGDFNVVLENGVSDRVSLDAPLGVPFCPVSIGGAHKTLPSRTGGKCVVSMQHDLLETMTLKERMEHISTLHGIQQVSMDCANVLNSGLDAYLKGLIRSCTELNGARHVHGPTKSGPVKHPTHYLQIQPEPEPEPKRVVSLLDFRVAMELNPKQLGEDWPVLLEKICINDFEE